ASDRDSLAGLRFTKLLASRGDFLAGAELAVGRAEKGYGELTVGSILTLDIDGVDGEIVRVKYRGRYLTEQGDLTNDRNDAWVANLSGGSVETPTRWYFVGVIEGSIRVLTGADHTILLAQLPVPVGFKLDKRDVFIGASRRPL